MHVLVVNPFHGGSHRQFVESAIRYSRHCWMVIPGQPVHWKWRMRSAPLELAATAADQIAQHGYPDIVLCTDMLDLPQWRGLLRDPVILQTPTAAYFHESQWSYPLAPGAREDFHYGYTNLLSALAADQCWFNSPFHRDDFLSRSRDFVSRMPDAARVHDFDTLASRCRVLPPGFDPPEDWESNPQPDGQHRSGAPVRLGWVSRWEHDKRADRLLKLCQMLSEQDVAFELVLLGARPRRTPESLLQLRNQFGDCIIHDGFASSKTQYWKWLGKIDVVFSAADHEFFGIAVCEAIWAGSYPVLPDRLSYQALVPDRYRYTSLDRATHMIKTWCENPWDGEAKQRLQKSLTPLLARRAIADLDVAIERLAGRS